MKLRICFFSLIVCLWESNAARILGIIPITGKSHFYYNEAIFKSLVLAGHHVTLISRHTPKKSMENFTIIEPLEVKSDNDNPLASVPIKSIDMWNMFQLAIDFAYNDCDNVLQMPFIQNLMYSQEKFFDVLFIEIFFLYECYLPLAEKLAIPVIGTSSMAAFPLSDYSIGNPKSFASQPFDTAFLGTQMSFFERLQNAFHYTVCYCVERLLLAPKIRTIYSKYYSKMDQSEVKISLIFSNNHVTYFPRPVVPTVVYIGGIHVEMSENQQLPSDIQKFMNEAKHGVILFSLGSLVSGMALTQKVKTALKEAFAEIPQRVIWKFDEDLEGLSDNVLVSKWLPQKEILGHPKLVAFMSHCGLMSTYEAIYNAKPMITMPVFADQPSTAVRLQELGVGVYLDIMDTNKKELIMKLDEVINNTKFRNNMKKLSKEISDNPITAAQSVVYWTEYIFRHNGTQHLRTVGADMPLYQYLLLDIIAFITTAVIFSICSLVFIYRKLKQFCIAFLGKNTNDDKKMK